MTPSTMPEAPSPRGSGSPASALFWKSYKDPRDPQTAEPRARAVNRMGPRPIAPEMPKDAVLSLLR